jgi:glutamine amidotransferase
VISIIDYGMGNLKSVKNALDYLKVESKIVNKPEEVKGEGIIVPGVGAFPDGMGNLKPFVPVLTEQVSERVPLLGICLGMQMLFEESEEGGLTKGLNMIPGRVVLLPDNVIRPQMGWNFLNSIQKDCPLVKGVKEGDSVYFVHSYYPQTKKEYVVGEVEYGVKIPAVVWNGNGVFGTQFHPEKSGEVGLRMLRNFCKIGVV